MPDPDDTGTLKIVQDERARDAEREADEAREPEEALAHQRRAEKAAYLRDKLDEADQAG